MTNLRIEDYALISDCGTAALVGRNGSIDWLCWPRFDSAACFAALLGECENGRWLIAPKEEPIEVSRHYRSGTLILETEFRTKTGSARLVDFMIPGDGADLVRIVIGRQGQVTFAPNFWCASTTGRRFRGSTGSMTAASARSPVQSVWCCVPQPHFMARI